MIDSYSCFSVYLNNCSIFFIDICEEKNYDDSLTTVKVTFMIFGGVAESGIFLYTWTKTLKRRKTLICGELKSWF